LVTGAAGFVGSHLIRKLQYDLGMDVIALDDLSGGFRSNIPEDIEFVEGSINDDMLLAVLFEKHKFNYVYHLAAYAAEGLSHFIRRFNYTNNLLGSINLINESVKNDVECFIFTSSIAVYGDGQVPYHEDMIPLPEDPYGISKYAVELDLKNALNMFGLNHVIFRPHNVYGEFQNLGDRYRNVIGIFMNQIMSGDPITIFGDGEQKRAFTYIADIIPSIANAPNIPEAINQIFNIGADNDYSINELAKQVLETFGMNDFQIEHLPKRNEVEQAFSNHNKEQAVFGNRINTPLERGLRKMHNWSIKHEHHKVGQKMEPEIIKNLPPAWNEN